MKRLLSSIFAAALLLGMPSGCGVATAPFVPDGISCPEDPGSRIREKYRPLEQMLARVPYQRVLPDNEVEVIVDGPRKFELLCEDLENAKHYIHMEYYRFSDDEYGYAIRNILLRKAAEGVKVRCIVDRWANPTVKPRFYRDMKRFGVEVHLYHRLGDGGYTLGRINNFDHRKIVVIDGAVAYTGGMNLSRHYFNSWRDTHVRVRGPVVGTFQGIFLEHWTATGGTLDREGKYYFRPLEDARPGRVTAEGVAAQAVSSGREWEHEGRVLQHSYEWCLDHAERYFYMQNPYFAPPDGLLRAIKEAAGRGVDVRIMLPEFSDVKMLEVLNQSYYRELLEAGVRIFHRVDPFMHTKAFVTDDYVTSVGTANADGRSLALNYEDNVYFYDEGLAVWSREEFLIEEEEYCKEVFLSDIESWSCAYKARQGFLRLFAPQF